LAVYHIKWRWIRTVRDPICGSLVAGVQDLLVAEAVLEFGDDLRSASAVAAEWMRDHGTVHAN
jgi:hypothetical protein